jgi:hypothetical protein
MCAMFHSYETRQHSLPAAAYSLWETAKLESAKLEGLVSGGEIDRIEVAIFESRTNILTGGAAQQYGLSFRETNRIAEPDRTKAEVATDVILMNGTNKLGRISQYDNGLWRYGDYSFRFRISP